MAARRARRPGSRSGPQTVALITALAAGSALLTLGAVAWATPETITATRSIEVQQRTGMTYTARMPRSSAYPTGRIQTGDPVFLRLVPGLEVRIAYRAKLSDPAADGVKLDGADGLTGTRRVTAELRSANGWHRGFELLPRSKFIRGGFDAVARLDLQRVRSLITDLETTTGIADAAYTVSIRTEVALKGTVNGRSTGIPVRVSLFPELTFSYDGMQLQLVEAVPPLSAGTAAGPGGGAEPSAGTGTVRSATGVAEVLRSQTSAILIPRTDANHLDLLGEELPIRPTRIGALASGLALLGAIGVAGRSRRKAARRITSDRMVRRTVRSDGGPAELAASSRSSRSLSSQSPASRTSSRLTPSASPSSRLTPSPSPSSRLTPSPPTAGRPTAT
ncbi:MAG TPA: hypothetical protein VLL08_29280, partial [Kineosporiaceae bacterium]|nr:hypothetical protein [Kineosporiaceae bacterium]